MKLFRSLKQLLKAETSETSSPVSESVNSHVATITIPADSVVGSSVLAEAQGYLAGQMLVATPVIDSGCFHKSVVYLFAHSAEGAMGVIINQPVELVNVDMLLDGVNMSSEMKERNLPTYFGGPVEKVRGFVVHSTDYYKDFSLARSGELAVTASSTILTDIAAGHGPNKAALVVGYASWGAGQLEAEIESNSWITVPATEELMFGTENELKWATASKSLGIDMAFYFYFCRPRLILCFYFNELSVIAGFYPLHRVFLLPCR